MKKLLLILVLLISVCIETNAQSNYKFENNCFSFTKTVSDKSDEQTPYLWKDSKGNEYPIYISKTGSCYIKRISKKSGKEYKQYLGAEISSEICKKLGRTYTTKSKNKK